MNLLLGILLILAGCGLYAWADWRETHDLESWSSALPTKLATPFLVLAAIVSGLGGCVLISRFLSS